MGREDGAPADASTRARTSAPAIPAEITPEFVRDAKIARGRAIIPNNINHPESPSR